MAQLVPVVPQYTGTILYVAPNGSDGNLPCTTLAAPCQSLNGVQGSSSLIPGATVLLRGGIYSLPKAQTMAGQAFSPAVGGNTTGGRITYAAYPYETPILTGAVPLTGWALTTTGACVYNGNTIPNCWSTVIPLSSNTVNFDYLIYVPVGWPPSYVANVMSRRSESMNTPYGYKIIVSPVSGSNQDVIVATSDLPSAWASQQPYHEQDIKFYNFRNWNVDVLRFSNVTTSGLPPNETQLTFTGPTNSGGDFGFAGGQRYLIVNSREYFKANAAPGTFYVDCGTTPSGSSCNQQSTGYIDGATVYYIANSNENPQYDTILAPQTPQLVTDGNAGPPGTAGYGYLTFRGLVFAGDNFLTPSTGYPANTGQAGIPAALSFVDTTNVTVDSSIIAHTSGWGLEFTNDQCTGPPGCSTQTSATNGLINSLVYDTGASGVRLGRYPPGSTDSGSSAATATNNSVVQNNLFTGMDRLYPNGEDGCIWIGSSHDNIIQYNECADSYGGGTEVGPAVGITQDYAYNNTVQLNSFHDIGEGVIFDFGCVHFANFGGYNQAFLNGITTSGDIFENNICHDVTHPVNYPAPNGGTGIYIDNNSQCILAASNLVYRTSGALFFSNGANISSPSQPCTNSSTVCPTIAGGGGCENLVTNNIFAYSYQGPIQRGLGTIANSGDSFLDFTFSSNFVYYDTTAGGAGNGPQSTQATTDYWTCYGTPPYGFPCTSYFNFATNDYWSASNGSSPRFFTTDSSHNWTQYSFLLWRTGNPVEDNGSISQYPNFVNPLYPFDNYMFNGTTPLGSSFSVTAFSPTYAAGRNNPVLFAPATAASFPLQLLSPLAF